MGCGKSGSKREVHSDTHQPQGTRKVQKRKNLILQLNGPEKIRTKCKRKKIIKIRVEVNKVETKRKEMINETKSSFFRKINLIKL